MSDIQRVSKFIESSYFKHLSIIIRCRAYKLYPTDLEIFFLYQKKYKKKEGKIGKGFQNGV